MRITYKSVDFEYSNWPSETWRGLKQAAKGLNNKRPGLLRKKDFASGLEFDISSSLGVSPAFLAGSSRTGQSLVT